MTIIIIQLVFITMRQKRKINNILIIFLFMCNYISAQNPQIKFKYLEIKNDLALKGITNTFQIKKSFISLEVEKGLKQFYLHSPRIYKVDFKDYRSDNGIKLILDEPIFHLSKIFCIYY